eukprot:scaffold187958_cov22-Tisochrysis_lutea.AAC.3
MHWSCSGWTLPFAVQAPLQHAAAPGQESEGGPPVAWQAPPQHAAAPGQKSEGSPPVLQSLGSMMSKLQTLDEMLQVPGLLQVWKGKERKGLHSCAFLRGQLS